MLALGKLFQDLLTGGIDKIAALGGDTINIVGTFGIGVVNALKTFIAG